MKFGFKKYLISMSICLVTIFVLIARLFVPVTLSADILSDKEVINKFGTYSCPRTYISYTMTNQQYETFVKKTSGYKYYCIVSFKDSDFFWHTSYYCNNEKFVLNTNDLFTTLSFSCNFRFTFVENSSGGCTTSYGTLTGGTSTLKNSNYDYYVYLTTSQTYNPDYDFDDSQDINKDNTFNLSGFFKECLNGYKNPFSAPQYLVDGFYGLFENFRNSVANVLGLSTDSEDFNTAINCIADNDYSNEVFSTITSGQLKQIQTSANNLKKVTKGSINYIKNTDTYSFKDYNPSTNTYPVWYTNTNYYYDYIWTDSYIYDSDIDLSEVIYWLQTIDFDLTYNLDLITNKTLNMLVQINNDFNTFAVGFNTFVADFNAFVGGLGAIIGGAIGVAWADIKADLDLMLGDLVIKLGDNNSSDDDTIIGDSTNNNIIFDISPNFENTLTGLFDDLKLTIKDLLDDINITVNNPDNSDTSKDEPQENDFWLDVKNIVIRKIPLYYQCVQLFEPVTNVNSNYLLDSNTLLQVETVEQLPQSYSINTSSVGDEQLEFDTPVDLSILGGLVYITSSADNSVHCLTIPLNAEFYGYKFERFSFDLSYYYLNYREKLSNVLLTVCYLAFAWHIIHSISKFFGHVGYDDKGE